MGCVAYTLAQRAAFAGERPVILVIIPTAVQCQSLLCNLFLLLASVTCV
jgi:hypothetical protein